MLSGGISKVAVTTIHGQGVTEVQFRNKGLIWRLLKLALLTGGLLLGGGIAALLFAVQDQPLMLALWLTVWVIVGGFIVLRLIWGAVGVTRLTAFPDRLDVAWQILGLGPRQSIPADRVGYMRWIADNPTRSVTYNRRRIPQSAIEISYDGTLLRTAHGISEAEAQPAIAVVLQRIAVARRRR